MQTVRSLSEDEIEIDVDSACNCSISSGRASFSISCIKGEDFPSFPELVTDKGFEIESDIVAKMISKVIHSVAEQSTRQMLCGAYFSVKNNTLEVVSCNTFILSKCTVKCDISSLSADGETDFNIIIPGHALSELSKILLSGENEKIKMYVSRKHAIVNKGDITFFTRTIDSEYIDYNRIIPKDNDIIVNIEKEKLLDSLERANIIADEKIKGSDMGYVKLKAEDQILYINSSSVNGRIKDEIECVHEGNDIEIGFNCRYIMNSVRVAEGENIKISMKGPTLAITIEDSEKKEDFDYIYIVLPMRIKEGN
jgi:DNA polymerase-3 subunit beta